MSKLVYIISIILLILIASLMYYRIFSETKQSKIVEKTIKRDGKIIGRYKTVELFPKKSKNEIDQLKGRVMLTPNNPEDANSKMMVTIKKGKELIVVTNSRYVRTLEYMYYGRKINLKGIWQKDAIIFGKRYRVFRVEDIKLDETKR